jgi:hypothetical protein
MSFAGKWMELEIIMLNKISPAQIGQKCMFSLIYGIYIQNDDDDDYNNKKKT